MKLGSKIIELFISGYTYKEINNKLGCSKSTVSYYCSKLDNNRKVSKLSDSIINKIKDMFFNNIKISIISKELKISKPSIYKYTKNYKRPHIKKTNSENVSNYRKRIKIKAVEYKGGKCIICGYNKCLGALHFHHIDPNNKDISLSKSGNTKSWNKMKLEIDKCILVCANCHQEIHDGIIKMDS